MAKEVLGNSMAAWTTAATIFIAVVVILRFVMLVIMSRMERLAQLTKVDFDDFLIGLIKKHVRLFLYVVFGLYLASRSLFLPEGIVRVIDILFVVSVTLKAIVILQDVIVFFIQSWANRGEHNLSQAAMAKNIQVIVKIVLWSGAVLFVLNNLGINVTAAVAGLGVGGVAVALAAQAILGDAFSSFAIYMDKPFEVGDFIIVGEMMGTVEHVGIKTTRIRSLGGEQLVFSNSDLTSSRIRNYKRMQERRIVFEFGVVYQTSASQMRQIPDRVKNIVASHDNARFDRAHFKQFGDYALICEVVYYVLSSDYNTYMDLQQSINIKLMEDFESRGIEFAYPTQQLYVTRVGEAA